jgi:putative spermidine/putrescine transport system permease protein
VIFFVYPVLEVLYRSLYRNGFTLSFYQRLFQSSVYVTVFWLTFRTAGLVTLICLLLGYPFAYFLAGVRPRTAKLLMVLVIFPFFTSVIVRTYSWMVLLGRSGIVNEYLVALGITAEPVAFLHNQTGVLIGMTYILLPFMVLTLYSVMRGIDPELLRAAHSVGATRFTAFRRVFLPLSLPGVAGGTLLVFIMSLGFFITPALMGGPSDIMIAMLIQREVELTVNWSFASTLAVALLCLTLAGFLLCNRVVGLDRLFRGRA